MKWPWRKKPANGDAAQSKRVAEETLRAEKHFTRYVEQRAKDMDNLTAEEFASRVRRAFAPRRPA